MGDLETLYPNLPVYLQHAACSFEGWRIKRARFGSAFLRLLKEAEDRTLWPREQVERYRDDRLCAFIRHCAESVPFYKKRFKEYGICPERVCTLEDMQQLPILTKKEVQEYYPELVSKTYRRSTRL